MLTTFPDGAERNRAIAAWSSVGGIGATAALIVGGALGWPWVFFLNVPVAAGLFVVFAATERRSAAPLVPLGLFRSRLVTGGNLVTLAGATTLKPRRLDLAPQAR